GEDLRLWVVCAFPFSQEKDNVWDSGLLAPGMIEQKPYNEMVDLCCIGVLCFELLVGKPPFESSTSSETYRHICQIWWILIFLHQCLQEPRT
ncbi:mCG140227, partial [Mus musculus]